MIHNLSTKAISVFVVIALEIILGIIAIFYQSISVIVILGIIATVLIFIEERIGYLFCVASLPFSGVHILKVGETSVEFIQPLLAFTILAWLIKLSIKREMEFELHPIYLPMSAFLLWALISCSWSGSYFGGLWGVIKALWVMSLVPFSINMIRTYRDLKSVLMIWSMVSLIAGVLAFGTEAETNALDTMRSTGAALHPNVLAMYLSFSIFVLIGYFTLSSSLVKKGLLLVICSFDFGALIAAGSRGAFFGLICGLLVMGVGRWRFKLYKPIMALMVIGICGVLLFKFLPSSDTYTEVMKRAAEVLHPTKIETLAFRTFAWREAYKIVEKSHYMGSGVNSYERERKKVSKYAAKGHPHNFYLHILVELGVIGITIFLVFLFQVWFTIYRGLKRLTSQQSKGLMWAFAGGLSAFLIHATLDFTFDDPELWFFIGVTVAATSVLLRIQSPALSEP
jgi:O-antigen ligase